MTRLVRVLAVGSVACLGAFGALFVAGETLADPGGWRGAGLVACWLLPMIGLVLLALRRPAVAVRLFPWLLAVATLVSLADAAGVFPHGTGPAGAVVMFAVAVPCGMLGVHRAAPAAGLVLVGALAQAAAVVVEGGHVGGSTGALVVPLLICGGLLLLAALLERYDARHPHAHALS